MPLGKTKKEQEKANILQENFKAHNELAFRKATKIQAIGVIPSDKYIIVSVNKEEIVNKQAKTILNKGSSFYVYKSPQVKSRLRNLKGITYYKNLSLCAVTSIQEICYIDEYLPEAFWSPVVEVEKPPKKELNTFVPQVPVLSKKQLKLQEEKIMEFLGILNPDMIDWDFEKGKPKYIAFPKEIRPIKRDAQDKHYAGSMLYYNLRDFSAYLQSFLGKLNGHGYDVYYSVYNFYPKRERIRDKFKVKSKRITNDTAESTCILPIDLDGITEQTYLQIKSTFESEGLFSVDLNTGHGYQMIFLLDEYSEDLNILKQFVTLLESKGIPVDTSAVDPARVMRLPYTFNCKCLSKKSKYYGKEDPVFVKLLCKTSVRYALKDIFHKVQEMPLFEKSVDTVEKSVDTVEKSVDTVEKSVDTVEKSVDIEEKSVDTVEKSVDIEESVYLLKKYPNIAVSELHPVIQKILLGTKEGMRNNAILFMLPYFRNYKSYSLDTIKSIFQTWGKLCSPSIPAQKMNKIVVQLCKYTNMTAYFGKYTKALKEEYGVFDLSLKGDTAKIKIPNKLIKAREELPSHTLHVYIALLMSQSTSLSTTEILERCKISRRTFFRSIAYLVQNKYVLVRKNSKRHQESYAYSINQQKLQQNTKNGYVNLAIEQLQEYITTLNTSELFTFLYLSMVQRSSKTAVKLSQQTLGAKVNRSASALSQTTTSLHKHKYIIKTTKYSVYKQTLYCEYKVV